MNGVVLLVGGLLLVAVIKLIMDRNWIGLLLCVVALFLVFGAGHHARKPSVEVLVQAANEVTYTFLFGYDSLTDFPSINDGQIRC